jgi:GatB domain
MINKLNYQYGLDAESADWWNNKRITFRWDNNHFSAKSYWFSDLFELIIKEINMEFPNKLNKEIILKFNKYIINDVYTIFAEDDFTFFYFLYTGGKEILKFLIETTLKNTVKSYEKNIICKFTETNAYYYFCSLESIMIDYPCETTNDDVQLRIWCSTVIADNPKPADDYRKGKFAALNSLKGQVMKLSKGKANIVLVGAILEEQLKKT